MRSEPRLIAISDDAACRSFLLDGFSEEHRTVTLLNSGDPAIEHLRQSPIDLVLLDNSNGLEKDLALLAAIRDEWPADQLPVIVLTDLSDYDSLMQLLEAGANDFVLKPLDVDKVADRIQSTLERRENASRLLEEERQRILTEALSRASATTAVAMGSMIDELEGAMSEPHRRAPELQACLNDVLLRTERTVAVIDRLRRIATLKEVPYATRSHLLEKLAEID